MNRQTRNSDKPELWRSRLIELRNKSGLTYKQIAEKENIGEKTVSRVFSGEAKNPGVVLIRKIIHALGGTVNDIFEESDAVICSKDTAALQDEVTRLTEENAMLTSSLNLANIELSVQKDKITALENENKILNLKIEYEEKLIAVHNFYNKLAPNS
jgi:transcriptional regulator with XRE-family HTH domain